MNILLTSAGRRTYLVDYFKTSLGGKGLVHASNSIFSPALCKADKYVITPIVYDDSYIDFLLRYVEKHDISIIISLFDIDLPILAQSKGLFKEKGVEIIVSDFEVTQICNDKWKTNNFLVKNGFETPQTFIDIPEAKKALSIGNLNFPLIVKPRWGMGSVGIYKIENEIELEVFHNKVKNEIENSYLKYESRLDINKAILIQEYLSGQEYGLDIFNDLKGNYIRTFVKRKLAMRSGETDSAVTEDNTQLRELGKKISEKLKHIANLDVDCFIVNNKTYVLEMNCRFGGGYPFTHLAGVNLPKVILDLFNNEKIDPKYLDIKYGIEMVKDIQPIIVKK